MSTFVSIIRAVLEEMSEGPHIVVGETTAAGTTATLVDTDNLKETSGAADAGRYDGQWLRFMDSAGTPVENIRIIKSYAPSTGTLVPEANFDNASGSGKAYEIHQKLHPTRLKTCITDALAEMRYQEILPLTLLSDGDMEGGTVGTYWGSTNATVAYDTSTVLFGKQSLKITDSGSGEGYATPTTYVSVTPGEQLIIWAPIYSNQQGVKLVLWDVQGATTIDDARHDEEGWGLLFFTATVPEDCYEVYFRIAVMTASGVAYVDHIGILRANQKVYNSPSWLTKDQDVIKIVSFPLGNLLTSDNADFAYAMWRSGPQHEHLVNTIYAHRGVVPLRLALGTRPSEPLFVIGKRRYPSLSADSDTTTADAAAAKAGALAFAFRRLGKDYKEQAKDWARIFASLRRGDEPPATVRQRSNWSG